MSGDASQAHIFSITIERKKEERAGPTERMFKASVLIALFAAIPCDGFGFTPSLHTPSRFASQRLSAANSLRSGASSRPSILGLSLSSSSPPKTMDKYKLEAVGSSLASSDSGKVKWPLLSSTRFTHPLDTQATAALKRIPFAETIVRDGFGSMVEQAIFLDNLSNAVRVGPKQLPEVYNSLMEAKAILGLNFPVDIYVRQNPTPNAYTMAMQGKKPFIVLHSSLLELLSPEEVQAVIAHELGHLKCEHGVWITLSNLLTVLASEVPGVGQSLGQAFSAGTLRWLRAAELSCDRAALLVSQNPRTVVSVIMKLSGGGSSFAKDLNPDDYMRQALDFEQESEKSFMFKRMRDAMTSQLSHPLPVERVRELDKWSKSADYRALLATGMPVE